MAECFRPFEPGELEQSIPERFEQQVQRFGERLAVKCPREQFTYDQLNAAANCIAGALLENEREPGERVVLLISQRAMLFAAILGVLKAGKIYVPLDLRYPAPVLAAQIADASPRVILCDGFSQDFATALATAAGTHLLNVDLLDTTETMPDPRPVLAPDALACLYYTSGSTGEPKGVIDSHRNVLHNVMRYSNGLRVTPEDRLSLVQSCSFSGCMSTQFTALLNGAALFPFDFSALGPAALGRWMRDERLTMFHGVPALFRSLVEAAGDLPDIRIVRLEGDKASWSDADLFRRACSSDSILVNGLGTTETGLVRRFVVTADTPIETGPLPLGYPVEGAEVLVVDADGNELEAGSVGEIAVRSEYLATAYWRKPQLTAAAFRADPAGTHRRVYRTGDLGRYRPDGCLEYHGRVDGLSKIRGERVATGVVEKALLALGFAQAIVVSRHDGGSDPRLIAYVVPSSNPQPDVSTIRRSLEQSIPRAWVPSAFVTLPSLPLTEHGKVDAKALPPPGHQRPDLAATYVAPRNSLETELASLWATVLEIDNVGVNDRFVDLGGDSLSAARLMTRLRARYGIDLPIAMLFESATISELARRLETTTARLPVPPGAGISIPALGWTRSIPLTDAQRRIWVLHELDPAGRACNEPSARILRGSLNHDALSAAFRAVVSRHDALRMRLDVVDGVPMQNFDIGPTADMEVAELGALEPAGLTVAADPAVKLFVDRRFDLKQGPPIRALLARIGPETHLLVVVIHHIACDAWSIAHFWRELALLYSRKTGGDAATVPRLRVGFADYARWEAERVAPQLARHLDYWHQKLAAVSSESLFGDGVSAPGSPVGVVRFALDLALAERIRTCAARDSATPFSVFVAALVAALASETGIRDVLIGAPVAGRSHEDVEPLIGCFAKTVVLRTELSGDETFRQVLTRVRNGSLEAQAHQDVPLELLGGGVRREQSARASSLFSVAFSLQDFVVQPGEFVGLQAEEVDIDPPGCKVDLALSARSDGGAWRIQADYDATRIERPWIESFIQTWKSRLVEGVTRPERPAIAPPTTVAAALTDIWQDALRIQSPGGPGVRDAFIDLGGDSLTAMRILARIESRFGTRLTTREFFEASTIEGQASLISQRSRIHLQPPSGATVEAESSQPLTPGQTDVWTAIQLHPDFPVYNEPFTITFNEPIDPTRLGAALDAVVARHDALRTGFVEREGIPRAVVHDHARVDLDAVSLDDATAISERATALARQPFDLASPPLLRALLATSGNGTRLFLTVHHLVIDAFGLYYVFLPQLRAEYEAISRGDDARLNASVVPPVASASIERRAHTAASKPSNDDVKYWSTQLEDAVPLELPVDFSRSGATTGQGAYCTFSLGAESTSTLTATARQLRTTLFATLGAAFVTVLHRWSDQDDLLVATFDAGRPSTALEEPLGCWLRTLPIRIRLRDDPPFAAIVRQFHETVLDAIDHGGISLPEIVAAAFPQRGRVGGMMRVAFVMEPSFEACDQPWTINQYDVQTGTAKFDLTLEVEVRDGRLLGRFEYATDLFERATIERLIETWMTVLESVPIVTTARVSHLPLLCASQRDHVVVELNRTERPYPRDATIHELFEQQVERAPDAPALVGEGESLTYAELDARSNCVANELLVRGLPPQTPVAILEGRSPRFIVAALGVLKAGAAYVPVDPLYPAVRQQFLVAETGAPVVLARDAHAVGPAFGRSEVLSIDSIVASGRTSRPPACRGAAESLAYIMFTSGSTGEPKGVAVRHRGVVRLVVGADYIPFGRDERYLFHSAVTFDASTFEIWAPLLTGGTCVILENASPALHEIRERLCRGRVTTLWLTSVLFNTIVDHDPEMLQHVRHVLAGGESLSVTHVRRAQALLPSVRFFNGYGPTEATTFSCVHEIRDAIPENARSIPIGRPIANTTAFVVDRFGEPVPIGFPGELMIGGDGVARGYVNRPELTRERFVAAPDSLRQAGLLYRTGDRVRWRADDTLEFLGRFDRQLKIRGFRIEPGEVEAELDRHPAVAQSVVHGLDEHGEKCLVAYVTTRDGTTSPTAHELRAFLRGRLPEHMVPTRWTVVDRLPTGATGKVDCEQLARAAAIPSGLQGAVLDPSMVLEISGVFARVLNVPLVAPDDDFFTLGGHSLTASILAFRLRERFGIDVPLRQVFETPSPTGLAAWIGSQSRPAAATVSDTRPRLVPVRTGPGARLVIAPSIVGELSALERLWDALPAETDIRGFQLPLVLDPSLDSIETIAAGCVEILESLAEPQPFCVAGYSFGGLIAFEIARQWTAGGRPRPKVVIIDTGPAPQPPGIRDVIRRVGFAAQNLPYWVQEDLLKGRGTDILLKARRKLRRVGRRLASGDVLPGRPAAVDPDDVFDTGALSPDVHGVMKARLSAANRYAPRRYPGDLTLVRPRARPLLHGLEPDLGWTRIVEGGVHVEIVPGNHETMLDEPNVRILGTRLAAILRSADRG